MNCCLIIAEKGDNENIAILHLKKSIRKGQVDKLLKLKCQRKMGKIDEIKSDLKGQGYSVFRFVRISGSKPHKSPFQLPKRVSTLKSKRQSQLETLSRMAAKDMASAENMCGSGAVHGVPACSTQNMLSELLVCLEGEVGIDVSGCTHLPQAIKMVCETIKSLMLDLKILFTNIEDLQDDRNQDRSRIRALKEKYEGLQALYEAKLEVKKNNYDELYSQYQNLQARCSHIERRETETMEESYRRLREWKTHFVSAAP